jgi:putative transposase
VLVYAFNWKQLSISAALGYRWDGKRCRLWFQTQPGSYNDERLIAFVRDLKKHMHGQKATLIWDGLPAHKSRKMKEYLESQRSWLQIETRSGYSPDLNPVEDLWSNIKCQELANRCVAGLGEAEAGVRSGMDRVRQSRLPFSFLHHAGLFF